MSMPLLLLAALALLAPEPGAVVPTLREGQQAYLAGARNERFLRMDNPAERQKLFRLGATQQPLKLEWSGDTNAVYRLTVDYAAGGAAQEFVLTNRTVAYITNLELDREYVWSVSSAAGETSSARFRTAAEAPRLLRAEGVGNFRDLGGWRTTDGRIVRQDRIYRSAGLRFSSKSKGGFLRRQVELGARRVTDAGLATLKTDFKVRTDLELRTPQETAGMTGTLLGPEVRWVNISFAAYGFIDNQVRGREPFARIFREFTDERNYPILMHCSGGRDRTGTLAFLLNGLLGVAEDDLCRDWETSVFADAGDSFTSDRIVGLLALLNSYPGETLRERIETYVKGCGITAAEIEKFRSLMLADKER